MRIVLDTNVAVSGLLNLHGPSATILKMIAAGKLSVCLDGRILGEYRDVLFRPAFPFRTPQVETLLEQICAAGETVAARPLAHPLPDPDDEPFLEVAIAARAEYLATGNARHYPVRCRRGVKVVSPREFLEILRHVEEP